MKLKPLLTGVILSVVTASAVASDEGIGTASGESPLVGSGGKAAVPVVENLNTRQGYWTSERYRKAKPIPLPTAGQALPQTMMDDSVDGQLLQDSTQEQPGISGSGQPPLSEKPVEPLEKRLYVPDEKRSDTGNSAALFDVGLKRAYFSSQTLTPLSADREYPYSTAGRLFFRIPNEGSFVCSGAVISPRLILTAGHCVHSGSGNEKGWFTNFEFVPAYRDGVAPFSIWKGSSAFVTTPWYDGKGQVPNVADYALIETEDQTIDGVSRKIGEVVGYLGFQTNRLIPNHAHLLGYPVAFDGGERMHQVTAQSYKRNGQYNTVLYGSDMTGGSSGGPWIMNFGAASSGQTGAKEPARNLVIGLTSYGYESLQLLGSSTLDDNFTSLLSNACSHRDGNCQ